MLFCFADRWGLSRKVLSACFTAWKPEAVAEGKMSGVSSSPRRGFGSRHGVSSMSKPCWPRWIISLSCQSSAVLPWRLPGEALQYGNRVRGTVDASSLACCCHRGPQPLPLPPCTPSGPRNSCPLHLRLRLSQPQPSNASAEPPAGHPRVMGSRDVLGPGKEGGGVPGAMCDSGPVGFPAGFDCAWP